MNAALSVIRYDNIYRVQMSNITSQAFRHTYCSNQAKAGMNPKTLRYLIGHSDISVTMNVYTHLEFDDAMTSISITKARANLYKTVSDVNEYSEPITITNNRGKNAVLVSEDDWLAIQETLYLNSVPGITQSILDSREEDVSECTSYNPEEEW